MPKFTHQDHDGPAQLDSVLQQFRDAALRQNRPWSIDIESIDGNLVLNGSVAPQEPTVADVEDTDVE